MDRVELYYFSGTGNSLHIVKELHKRIPKASVIPIVGLLNQDIIKNRCGSRRNDFSVISDERPKTGG